MKATVTDYEKIDLESYEERSAMIWAINNIRLPKNAPWDFEHRVWQSQIFDDMSQKIAIIKPTQIGMTTVAFCKMLYLANFKSMRVMYTLPRQDDVYDLVNGKLEAVMRESPAIAAKLTGINNVRFKEYGNASYLHFMESSVTPRMLDVDCLINDEVDMSNADNLEQYKARLDASEYKIHWKLSTPTIHDFGIDVAYKESDQKIWIVTCPRCKLEQEMTWEGNVKHSNGDTWYACSACDKLFTAEIIQGGRWIAQFPNRPISGYSVSQLMVTSIPPSSLWDDFRSMKTKNFYNLRLGKPYAQSTGMITKSMIYDKCINGTHAKEFAGNGYILGADQGNDIHVVIGKEDGNGILQIVHAEKIGLEQGFDRLDQLMARFKISKAVIDALPNRHSSKEFVNRYKHKQAYAAFYSSQDATYTENIDDGIVNINRSTSFDYLFERITEGKLWIYGSKNNITPEMKMVVSHLASLRRDEVVTKTKIGGEKSETVWINSGPDHFAHAINYLCIAADLARGASNFRVAQIVSASEPEPESRVRNNNPYLDRMASTRLRIELNKRKDRWRAK